MSDRLLSAIRLHQGGDLPAAEAAYRGILDESPNDPDALHYLGVLLHRKGESEQGARLVRKAIARSSGYVDAHRNLGNILLESGSPEKAEKSYRKAVALDSADAPTYSNLSIALRYQERFEDAIEAGLNAVKHGADMPVNWLVLGHALKRAGMFDSAIAAYYRALELDPEMAQAHTELSHTLYRLEKTSDDGGAAARGQIAAYVDWLRAKPDNPVARFMLAAWSGDETAPRVPDDVVKLLFDQHAVHFDQNLASLDYRVPDLMAGRVAERYSDAGPVLEVLDAGCGTGLCAADLRRVAARLTGVDLSAGMLEKAELRGHYDELVEAELTAYLETAGQRFDLVVCADTLCYFGDLGPLFVNMAGALKPGGRFLFTVEHLGPGGGKAFRINSSGRYSHTTAHVREGLENAGLTVTAIDEVVLRQEGSEAVAGLLVETVLD